MLIPLRVAHDCPGQDAALYVDTLAVLLDDSAHWQATDFSFAALSAGERSLWRVARLDA